MSEANKDQVNTEDQQQETHKQSVSKTKNPMSKEAAEAFERGARLVYEHRKALEEQAKKQQ